MQKCIETLDTNNKSLSEYNATSIRLAAKMKPNQQIYAELLGQKVCVKALLQQLNDDFDVVDMKNLNPPFKYDTDKSSHNYTNYEQLNK